MRERDVKNSRRGGEGGEGKNERKRGFLGVD